MFAYLLNMRPIYYGEWPPKELQKNLSHDLFQFFRPLGGFEGELGYKASSFSGLISVELGPIE